MMCTKWIDMLNEGTPARDVVAAMVIAGWDNGRAWDHLDTYQTIA